MVHKLYSAGCETPGYGLVNSIITLKVRNKGNRIICCHTPILINNSILDCAISPVKIRICLKAVIAHRIGLAPSQLGSIRASGTNRNAGGKVYINT